MDARCRRCAFWRQVPEDVDAGWGVCARVSTIDHPKRVLFSAVVVDGLTETAELHTHSEFGCVEFQRKKKRVVHSDLVYSEAP